MAEKAIASSSKVQLGLSYSKAAATTATTSTSPFARTECAVSLEKHLPMLHLPRPAGQYPVFFDLRSTTVTQDAILDALPHSLLGCVFREDKHLVELDCSSTEEQTALLKSPIDIPGHSPLTPLPPQTDLPHYTLVKLSNVPVRPVAALEVLLCNQFKTHGEVVEIGPHRIANRQWITRRWDLVVKTPAGESLEAPTLFELFSEQVHAWWIRSPKTCLTCKVVGHLSSSPLCPRRKKKASTARPAAASADSGVSSGSATAATTSGRRRRPRSRRSSKAVAMVEIPTGDFTIDAPLPKPTTPPTDSRSFLPSFTTAIQPPSTMDLDRNQTPPPPPPYLRCPFTYEYKAQTILRAATPEQMTEHCESLRRKYATATDPAVRSFIQLPIPDMAHHIQYSLDNEYRSVSPYGRILHYIPSFSRSPPSPSSRWDIKRSK